MVRRKKRKMVLQNPKENSRDEMRQLNHNLDLGSRLFLTGKSHTGKWDCNMAW